jgi:hypothetical protein
MLHRRPAVRAPRRFFFIAGRRSEMFISGGVNVDPAEIEAELVSRSNRDDRDCRAAPPLIPRYARDKLNKDKCSRKNALNEAARKSSKPR